MPWKASSVMEERLRFVARLLDGEAMTDICRDFGVSRKTGYKIFDRYKEHGLSARLHSNTSPSNMIHRACRPKLWCRSDASVVVNALLRLLLPSRSIHSRLSRHQRHRKQCRECL